MDSLYLYKQKSFYNYYKIHESSHKFSQSFLIYARSQKRTLIYSKIDFPSTTIHDCDSHSGKQTPLKWLITKSQTYQSKRGLNHERRNCRAHIWSSRNNPAMTVIRHGYYCINCYRVERFAGRYTNVKQLNGQD